MEFLMIISIPNMLTDKHIIEHTICPIRFVPYLRHFYLNNREHIYCHYTDDLSSDIFYSYSKMGITGIGNSYESANFTLHSEMFEKIGCDSYSNYEIIVVLE